MVLLVSSTAPILFPCGREAQYAVVLLAYQGAERVVVGGRDPQGAVGGLRNVPDAADLPVEKLLPVHDLTPIVQLQAPEPLSPQSGDEEVTFPLRDGPVYHDLRPTRGGFIGRPDSNGIDVPLVLRTLTLDLGPAVVLSGFDPVDLIPRVLAELTRVEPSLRVPREPLHVAVAVGVDGVARERIVGWDGTVGFYPQDLTLKRVSVLGVLRIPCVASGHVEHPVGSEFDSTPVVIRIDRYARQYGLGRLASAESYDSVVYLGRVVSVDVAVVPVIWRDGDAEQPALARATLWEGLDLSHFTGRTYPQKPPRVTLGNERVPAG